MKQLLGLLMVLLTARSVRAQDSSALVLEVRAQRVERSELERALDDELRGAADRSEQAGGHLSLTEDDSDLIRLTYRDALGNTATRDLRIARDDPEALEKITLAAANLVRDQGAGLLAELATPQARTPLDTEKPPPVKLLLLDEVKRVPAYNPCRNGHALLLGGDFAPFLGTSSTSTGRQSARYLSLNLGGSYSAGVRGLEVSIGFNIARRGACGVQHAIGFNLSLGDVRGLQLALANAAVGSVRGTQVGLGNFARGGANVQIGLGNMAVGDVAGGQIGVGNLTWGSVRGVQIGVGNLAGRDATVQIGVFNVSRRAKAPIGVISIVREGRTTLDTWVSENGTLLSGISHGGDYVHNLYAVGFRFGPAGTRVGYAFGIGVRLLNRPWLSLDLDSLFEQWSRTDYINSSAMVARARLTASVRVTERLGVFIAPGYAFMFSDDPDETPQAPLGSTLLGRNVNSSTGATEEAVGFTSLSVGLRVALSSAPIERRTSRRVE